eukprot:gene6221-10227_t
MFLHVTVLFVLFIILYIIWTLFQFKFKNWFKPKSFDRKVKSNYEYSKQIYSTKSGVVPDDLDAIIIGSGIGGLSLAGLLSKQGRRVLVLEQHDVAGGCCHCFEDEGFEFDTGIHYVGDMKLKENKVNPLRGILDHITDYELKWESMGESYDVSIIEGVKMEWKQQLEETIKNLVEIFPKEEEKIRKYFQLTKKVSDGCGIFFATKILPNWLSYIVYLFAGYYSGYRDKTCEEVMCGELGMSKELMFTLCYLSGDHGSLPSDKGSFIIQSLVAVHYGKSGGYYPVGGPKQISESIIPTIEATGGKVLVKVKVDSILIKDNKAYGVKTSKGEEILSKIVVSNAGVFNTFGKLVKNNKQFKSTLETVKEGVSHFYLFVGLKKSAKDLNLPKANYWIHPSHDIKNMIKFRESNDIEWDKCGYFISFPSSKDPLHNERYPNKSTCVVIAEANYDWVKEWNEEKVKNRSNDYKDFKDKVQEKLLSALLKQFPNIENSIEYLNVATPLTNEHYLASYKGSSYGLKFSSSNEIFKPETSIKNLYLTGQDVTCMGFGGAVSGAMISYISITGDDILTTLSNIQK